MKTFDFIKVSVSHNIKDPHSKSLEPNCISPFLAITTQSPFDKGDEGDFFIRLRRKPRALPVGLHYLFHDQSLGSL